MVSLGAKARLGIFVGNELNDCIQFTAIYADITKDAKSFTKSRKNKVIIDMMSKRDDSPSAI